MDKYNDRYIDSNKINRLLSEKDLTDKRDDR